MAEKLFRGALLLLPLMVTWSGAAAAPRLEKATFAGGRFWCMVPPFEKLDGVKEVISDPANVSYEKLLDVFWRQIDPPEANGQFVDRGSSYTSAAFYHDGTQRRPAEDSKKKLGHSGRFEKPIVTEMRPAGPFYRAEDYHQDYWKKNPIRYRFYRYNSGRDQSLAKIWGKEETMKSGKAEDPFVKPSKEEQFFATGWRARICTAESTVLGSHGCPTPALPTSPSPPGRRGSRGRLRRARAPHRRGQRPGRRGMNPSSSASAKRDRGSSGPSP